MNFITQLLPGLRDVRGPLVAGYLWLFAGWLVLGDQLPDRESSEAYMRVFELGDMLGQVGLAAAVSVAAYLVGSLLQTVASWIDFTYKSLKHWIARRIALAPLSPIGLLGPKPARQLLFAPPVFSLEDSRWVDGDRATTQALEDLVSKRLNACLDDLDAALQTAVAEVGNGAAGGQWSEDELRKATIEIGAVGSVERGWQVMQWMAAVSDRTSEGAFGDRSTILPSFSAARDIFGERATIKTRLMETAEHAGSEVERLYAESDFRFTIALPLAAVAFALADQSGDRWWLALLVAVAGLLAHSVVLRKHGGREMVEALRSRPDSEELDKITPVFRRYEEDAKEFAAALREEKWDVIGAAI